MATLPPPGYIPGATPHVAVATPDARVRIADVGPPAGPGAGPLGFPRGGVSRISAGPSAPAVHPMPDAIGKARSPSGCGRVATSQSPGGPPAPDGVFWAGSLGGLAQPPPGPGPAAASYRAAGGSTRAADAGVPSGVAQLPPGTEQGEASRAAGVGEGQAFTIFPDGYAIHQGILFINETPVAARQPLPNLPKVPSHRGVGTAPPALSGSEAEAPGWSSPPAHANRRMRSRDRESSSPPGPSSESLQAGQSRWRRRCHSREPSRASTRLGSRRAARDGHGPQPCRRGRGGARSRSPQACKRASTGTAILSVTRVQEDWGSGAGQPGARA